MTITTYATSQGLYTVCVNSTRRALISNRNGSGRWFLVEVTPEGKLANDVEIDVTRQLHREKELNAKISELLKLN